MENRVINIAIVAEVAEALKELKENMVFVGGAVISLYTDDPAADELRNKNLSQAKGEQQLTLDGDPVETGGIGETKQIK